MFDVTVNIPLSVYMLEAEQRLLEDGSHHRNFYGLNVSYVLNHKPDAALYLRVDCCSTS